MMTRYASHISLENCIGELEPSCSNDEQIDNNISSHHILNRFSGLKKDVVQRLMNGDNFHQIVKDTGENKNVIYQIKKELMTDFQELHDEQKRHRMLLAQKAPLQILLNELRPAVKLLNLQEFTQLYIYEYDPEAQAKHWRAPAFLNTLEQIWSGGTKSCTLAPREHMKTSGVINFLIKTVFTREYPLEINYYHLTDELALEKFRKMKRLIERNPILSYNFQVDLAKSWKDDYLQLADGTIIQPMSFQAGSVGKHPHIIVLDDVIDRRVIYSDQLNSKAIDTFYSNIYPMISKDEPDRKIIAIGTAQRKDDLYHSLPADFSFNLYKAVIDDAKQEVLCPEMYSYQALMKIKADVSKDRGEKYWLKEYMNTPFEAMGMIIKSDWLREYHYTPTSDQLKQYRIYQGWDLSVGKDLEKGDWTVGATIGVQEVEKKLMIKVLDIVRARLPFASRLQEISNAFNKWRPELVGIEDVTFQYDTVKTLRDTTLIPIVGIKALKNKVESFQTELAPYFENGQIEIPAWMTDLKTELLSLPVGEHDDMADAIKIAIKSALSLKVEPRVRFI